MVGVITVLVYTGIVSVFKILLVNKQFDQYHIATVHSRFHKANSFPFPSKCMQQFCDRSVLGRIFPVIPRYLIHLKHKNTQVEPDLQSSLYQMTNSFVVDAAFVGYLSSMQLL